MLLKIGNISGIYAIVNKLNGMAYIGSSVNMRRRRAEHLKALRKGRHYNGKLQRAWDKHGEEVFIFTPIETSSAATLLAREAHWVDYYDTIADGYNIESPTHPGIGRKVGDEILWRMRGAGAKGVKYKDGRYQAAVSFQGRTFHLGTYDSRPEAEYKTEYFWGLIRCGRSAPAAAEEVCPKRAYSAPGKGVCLDRGVYVAYANIDGGQRYIGRFSSLLEAAQAREKALAGGAPFRPKRMKSSSYAGVVKVRGKERWLAQPYINARQVYLGSFGSEEAAANAIKEYSK